MRHEKALIIFALLGLFATVLLTTVLLTTVSSAAPVNNNNRLANPGFESGINMPLNWSFIPNNGNTPIWDTISHSGARSIKISVSGTANSRSGYPRSEMIRAEPLQKYILSVWVKTHNAGGLNAPAVRVNEFDASGKWIRQTSLESGMGTNNWVQKQIAFQTDINTMWISVYANIWDGYGTFWMDDLILTGPIKISDIRLNGGGTISSLAINPASPNIVYATADLSGVYKSTDYGETWSHTRGGLNNLADWTVATIAVNPRNPNNLFIGSGEVWGHPKGDYGGLFRSDNGGKNWKLVTRALKFSGHGDYRQFGDGLIVFDPKNTYTIYAATIWDGIFKSTDGGNTWLNKGLPELYLTTIAINDSGTIYVSAGKRNSQNGGIFKSEDGGNTWITLNTSISAQKMVVKGRTIYVASKGTGIYKSIDGGRTWQLKNNGLKVKNFVSIAMDPTNSSILYAVSSEWGNNKISLYKTTNGADKWTVIPYDVKKNVTTKGWWKTSAWFSSGSHSLYVDPVNPLRIYLTDSYTVWRSNNGGNTWSTTAFGLETSAVSDIKPHPSVPNLLMIATKDITGFISYDGANTTRNLWGWGDGQLMTSNLYDTAFDPQKTNPSSATIFTVSGNATNGNLWKSIDSGKTWTKQTGLPDNKKYTGVAVDPIYPTNIYVTVGEDSIYKTTNGGVSWSRLSINLPDVTNIIRLEINPLQPSTLYFLDRRKGVFKSTNSGVSWAQYNTGFSPNLGVYHDFNCLTIDPKYPAILYAGGEQDGIYKTADGGTSWRQILTNFSCGSVAVDPNNNLNVFAGSKSDWWYRTEIKNGIYQSNDGGSTWMRIDDNVNSIPLASVSSLAVDPFKKGVLYVGTSGGGSYKVSVI